MAKTPRSYTREFNLEAVRLYETTDKTMAQVERELGITPYLLSKWVKQFRDEEIHRLKRAIEILKQEREILKKQWVSSPTQNGEI